MAIVAINYKTCFSNTSRPCSAGEVTVEDKEDIVPSTFWQRFSMWRDAWSLDARFEFWYPLCAGLAVFLYVSRLPVNPSQFDSLTKDVVPIATSVAAIFAGFQGALLGIVLALAPSRIARRLREGNRFGSLMWYIRSSIASLILFVALAMAVDYLRAVGHYSHHLQLTVAILCGCFTWSLAASVRIVVLMLKLIKIAAAE